MAGMSSLQTFALLGLIVVCSLALLLNMRGLRHKLRVKRGGRIMIWSTVALVIVLFVVAYGSGSQQGGEGGSGGSSRSGSHR